MSCGAELAKRRTESASFSGGIRAAINRRLSRPGVYESPEASKSSELQLADCQRIIEELNSSVANFRDLLIHIGKGHDNPEVRDKMRVMRKRCVDRCSAANRVLMPQIRNWRQRTGINLLSPVWSKAPVTQIYIVKLPTIKLEKFGKETENWQSFGEQFQSSVDSNPNLSTIDKHVFLRGYLQNEPYRLVNGINLIADTYETTKKLLMDKYGNKNRIIQTHLDFLENLTPIRNPSPTSLNEVYIDSNRRLQALRALGEDIDTYGRVLTPKILRKFPDYICCQWVIHAKRQRISEGDITQLIQFLFEEVESALTHLKIKDDVAVQFTPLQPLI
ncbi:hypothetical protein HNY73_002787 [Argiope bruennichi]|uniref:Uncharacterized protein n=1 Tax=Argiope bruennichi TaxID=94029 RepID=A0A8T0FX96_ARGBR|nr:hypothetical protein HNY73_002787 [Argiope bruennichi]